jgi:hypothetical protein
MLLFLMMMMIIDVEMVVEIVENWNPSLLLLLDNIINIITTTAIHHGNNI